MWGGCFSCAATASDCTSLFSSVSAVPPVDPTPVPEASQAARPRRSSTAIQRNMMDFTAEDMASNFISGCRRKSGRSATSCSKLARLDPHKDGDILQFVVRVARRSRLPPEVIEPFVENNHRLRQRFREDLESLEEAVEVARTAATAATGPEGFDEEASLLQPLQSKVTTLLQKWATFAVEQEVVPEPMEAEDVSAISRCATESCPLPPISCMPLTPLPFSPPHCPQPRCRTSGQEPAAARRSPAFQRTRSRIGGPLLATSGVTSIRRQFFPSLTLILYQGPRTSLCSRRQSQPRTWQDRPLSITVDAFACAFAAAQHSSRTVPNQSWGTPRCGSLSQSSKTWLAGPDDT